MWKTKNYRLLPWRKNAKKTILIINSIEILNTWCSLCINIEFVESLSMLLLLKT